ncbi:cysteine synthase family protein [Candidatus Gracilibacteria bacterium]|nr:cysteine synthase family protein [Candidatus Gracilibacteria bacterium]
MLNQYHLTNAIGNTPLVKLNNLFPNQRIFAKLEGQNPGGSIKDRPAKFMILEAIKRGELTKNKTILEATSGNMGISLSMIGSSLGFKVQILMSSGMSEERKQILRSLGAKLILTDPKKGTIGAIYQAKRMVKQNPNKYWFSNQFENPNNPLSYEDSLGPEIINNLPKVDYIVGGIGTSGTMVGLARFFKQNSPKTKIIAVIPPKGFKIQGIQNPKEDFRPKILEEHLFDKKILVSEKESFDFVKILAQKEGILGGLSSGAVLSSTKKINIPSKKNIVLILADRGEKYLSTGAFF